MAEQLSSVTDHRQSSQRPGWQLWFSRHNWPTWLGLCLILPLILYYWQHYNTHIQQQQQEVFQQHANQIELEIKQRIKHIELLLRANAAYISSSEYVSQAEWQHYVSSMQLPVVYPGIQALGIASFRRASDLPLLMDQLNEELQQQLAQQQLAEPLKESSQHLLPLKIKPAGMRPHYALISHIQPATGRNLSILGYDILTDPMRFQAAMRAASLNQPAITAKITLQQDGAQASAPGLVLMLPFYQSNALLLTAEQKQDALQGFVYAAFRVGDILPAAWHDPATALADIHWFSGVDAADPQLLFERKTNPGNIALKQYRHLDWYGQSFVLQMNSNLLLEKELLPRVEYELMFLGCAGLVVLFILLSYLNLRRFQAQNLTWQLQQQLQQQRQQLVQDEQLHSLALKASQLAWFEFDIRSGGAFYADCWWRMFDFNAPQLNPEPQQLFDMLHPSALSLFRQDLQRLLAHGPDQDQQQYLFVSRQGRQLVCLVHFYVVRSPEGDAIRLCCTMQDQTLQQQQADQRQLLALLCQLEVSLAFQLAQQLGLAGTQTAVESARPAASTDLVSFQQHHLLWILQFYCEAMAKTETTDRKIATEGNDGLNHSSPSAKSDDDKLLQPHGKAKHPLIQIKPPRYETSVLGNNDQPAIGLVRLISDLVTCYQPLAVASGLQIDWQPQLVSDYQHQATHRCWQVCCGLIQLACSLAKAGSTLSIALVPFQARITFRLQLHLDLAIAQRFQQEADQTMPVVATLTEIQQRLLAANFWAAQLGADFDFHLEQQQLSLQLLLHAKPC